MSNILAFNKGFKGFCYAQEIILNFKKDLNNKNVSFKEYK